MVPQVPGVTPWSSCAHGVAGTPHGEVRDNVLGGDTGEFTPSYNELKRFMLKVLVFHNVVMTCLPSNLCISIWSKVSLSRYCLSYFSNRRILFRNRNMDRVTVIDM